MPRSVASSSRSPSPSVRAPDAGTSAGKPNKKLKGKVLTSPNELYKVPLRPNGASSLFARTDAPAPLGLQRSRSESVYESKGFEYHKYVPAKGQAVKDCLNHTEEVMAGKQLAHDKVYSKVKGTEDAFGDSASGNLKAAKKAGKSKTPTNQNASPEVGDGYVIVRPQKPGPGESPYHAAPVIAKDGRRTFTAEVSAGESDGKRNATAKIFTQEVGSKRDSFHAQLSKTYPKSTTLVIEPQIDAERPTKKRRTS
jgi:hypothetical protein